MIQVVEFRINNSALTTLRSSFPSEFPKIPSSVVMLPMGNSGLGKTDWANNIQLNSNRFGDSNTCIRSGDEYQFLQTLAHELLHVNEKITNRLLSNSFKMKNPLGYFHRELDDRADRMITQGVIEKYLQIRNSNQNCLCK